MSDTRNKLQFFKEPVETKSSTDTDDFLNEYLRTLDRIIEEDEDYNTIVNTNYKGANHDRTSK
jgi:hypothetical protein